MNDLGQKRGLFPSTRWTLVRRAQGVQGRQAFGELLQTYWRPLFVFARLRGLSADDASDEVQAFMLHLLERQVFIENLDPDRGRLRSYLKTAFRHFLDNHRQRAQSHKRGGQQQFVTFDLELAERCVDSSQADPDSAYEREWALTVFENALSTLKLEYDQGLRAGPFELIQRYFSGEISESYSTLAAQYDMSVPQLKSFLHRARQRYRQILMTALADTLDDEKNQDPSAAGAASPVEAELTRLQTVISA